MVPDTGWFTPKKKKGRNLKAATLSALGDRDLSICFLGFVISHLLFILMVGKYKKLE